ncbi:MAG TPA: response regulator [Bryobacteraceae bacterium]|nr:response regulator [Bryobacteraceae bacterium]
MRVPHIVLIEDNPGDVMLVRLALEENGIPHTLTQYSSGADAVHTLCDAPADSTPVPDVILLDLNTPHMDGFDAVRKFNLSPQFSQVPLAILTSSRARSDKHRAELLGARFIEKPTQLDDFLSSVGNAVKEMLERVTATL